MARGFGARESGGFMSRRGVSWDRFPGDSRGTSIGETADGEEIFADDEGNSWTASGRDITIDGVDADSFRQQQYKNNERYFGAIARQKDAVDAAERLKEKQYPAGSKGALFKETYDAARKVARKIYDEAEAKAKAKWQEANPGKQYGGSDRQTMVYQALAEVNKTLAKMYPDPMLKYNPTTSLPADGDAAVKDDVEKATLLNSAAGLALAKLTDDKRKFLILKGYANNKVNLSIGEKGKDGWDVGYFNR